jgi:hypothetical protein
VLIRSVVADNGDGTVYLAYDDVRLAHEVIAAVA